jgi:hypothetical protein
VPRPTLGLRWRDRGRRIRHRVRRPRPQPNRPGPNPCDDGRPADDSQRRSRSPHHRPWPTPGSLPATYLPGTNPARTNCTNERRALKARKDWAGAGLTHRPAVACRCTDRSTRSGVGDHRCPFRDRPRLRRARRGNRAHARVRTSRTATPIVMEPGNPLASWTPVETAGAGCASRAARGGRNRRAGAGRTRAVPANRDLVRTPPPPQPAGVSAPLSSTPPAGSRRAR